MYAIFRIRKFEEQDPALLLLIFLIYLNGIMYLRTGLTLQKTSNKPAVEELGKKL